MIGVHADVTTELASGTAEIAWFIDLEPRDGTNNFRFKTSSIVPDKGSGYVNDVLLTKPITFKKKLGKEFDKYKIEIATAASGAVNTNIDLLLDELVAGTLDQATVTVGFYTASQETTLDICRVYQLDIGETTMRLTATNEIEAFKGKIPNVPHEPQSWNRIEDKGDNPDPSSPWMQLDAVSETSTTAGRYRKGQKITATERQGFERWWNPAKEEDDEPYFYPIAYGQKVIMKWEKAARYEPVVLSQGETGSVYQLLNQDGDIIVDSPSGISPTEWSNITHRDPFEENLFVTDPGETPRYTAGRINASKGEVFITFDGRLHYSYDVNGVKQGSPAVTHNGVTNPMWVFIDLCMNVLGVKWSQIDFSTAQPIAAELETLGYDLRFILKKPLEVKKVLNKIAKNGSFLWQWHGGVMTFTRRYATTDPGFQGWQLDFTETDINEDSFNHSDQSLKDAPNKFKVTYLTQGQDSEDRYFHRPMEHTFEVMDKDYSKEEVKELAYDWLYDPDDFDSATGDSLPQLEVIKEIRMSRVQKRFSFTTKNLNAFLLQGGDPVTVDYILNTLDTNIQGCELESMAFDGKNGVKLVLVPRADTWFSPDASIGINTTLNWTTVGGLEGNIPSYRYKMQAASSTSSNIVYLNMYDGVDDPRALAVGNSLWYYTIGALVSPDNLWGAGSNADGSARIWKYVGEIALVEEEATKIKVTLTANSRYTVPINYAIQCQPRSSHTSMTKTDPGGSATSLWTMTSELYFNEIWDFCVGSSGGKFSHNGGSSYTEAAITWSLGDLHMRSIVDIDGLTTDHGASDFPGVVAFKLRTQNGIIGDEFVYVFSERKSISKGDETTITDTQVGLLDLPFSDFSEIGVLLNTDWDSSVNPNVKYIIEYKLGDHTPGGFATGAADGYVYGAASAPEPAFLAARFTSNTTFATSGLDADKVFVNNDIIDFTEDVTFKLLTFDQDDAAVGSPVESYLTLTKVNHQFENYIATINKYAATEGAGLLLATTGWTKFATNWNTGYSNPEQFAGTLSVYPPNATVGTDITKWRRYSLQYSATDLQATELKGPTHSLEASGDAKLGYRNSAGSIDVWGGLPTAATANMYSKVEMGSLFFSFDGDTTERGEVNLGLSKTYSRQCFFEAKGGSTRKYFDGSQSIFSTGSIPNTSAGHRGAALVVCRGSYTSADTNGRFKPNVLASNLAVQGLMIGGQTYANPNALLLSNSLEYPTDATKGRVFFTLEGDDFALGSYGNEKFLASNGFNSGGNDNWHGYAYTNRLGHLVLPQLHDVAQGSSNGLQVVVKNSAATKYYETRYIPWTLGTPYCWNKGVNTLPTFVVSSTNYSGGNFAASGETYIYNSGGTYYLRVNVFGVGWKSVALT